MYIPYYELPNYKRDDARRYATRWDKKKLSELEPQIWQIIKDGGSKHQNHELLSAHIGQEIEADNDLRGFNFWFDTATIYSNNPHTLRYFDLDYCRFSWGILQNWSIHGVQFAFTKFSDIEFQKCYFEAVHFYGAVIDQVKFIDCEFTGRVKFSQCELKNVQFVNCYFSEGAFRDSKFDEQTHFQSIQKNSYGCSSGINNKEIATLYKGIKEGYQNGDCSGLARHYYFEQMKALRQFNSKDNWERAYRWFFESITGYGVKPLNVLGWMLGLFTLCTLIFMGGLCTVHVDPTQPIHPVWDGLLLSAGSFFTFGAKADLLKDLPHFFKILFVLEAAFGIALLATFITVLANFWTNWEK